MGYVVPSETPNGDRTYSTIGEYNGGYCDAATYYDEARAADV